MVATLEPVASEALSFLAFFAFLAGCSEASSKYSASVRGFLFVFLLFATGRAPP